jgi:hypothetical protein
VESGKLPHNRINTDTIRQYCVVSTSSDLSNQYFVTISIHSLTTSLSYSKPLFLADPILDQPVPFFRRPAISTCEYIAKEDAECGEMAGPDEIDPHILLGLLNNAISWELVAHLLSILPFLVPHQPALFTDALRVLVGLAAE